MAKDLPYFKFVISEWNDGDVTLCSLEAQGLFINLCSIYWSQEGKMSLDKSKRRFSGCNASAWEQLINDKVIKVKGDRIIINFLDEQFKERGKLSEQNAENAAKGWEKRRNNAGEMRPHTDGINPVSNIEEKREEKNKKEEKRTDPLRALVLPFGDSFKIVWGEWVTYRKEVRKKLTLSSAQKQIQFLGARAESEAIEIINQSIMKGYTGLFPLSSNGFSKPTKTVKEKLTLDDLK